MAAYFLARTAERAADERSRAGLILIDIDANESVENTEDKRPDRGCARIEADGEGKEPLRVADAERQT